MVKQLKKAGADVIVALTHLFIDDDKKLAEEVPEIDLILGGHDHDPFTWHDGHTLVHKSGQNAYFLTRIDLVINKNDLTSKVNCYHNWEVICNYRIPKDEQIAQKIAALEERFDAFAKEPIAKVAKNLDSTNPGVRSKEMTMGNLVADAIRHSCGTDIALICGGVIRGDHLYEPGTFVTLKDMFGELPFNNLNVAVEMTGKDILDALENGVSQVEGRAGRFLHVSGMKYSFDLKLKPGKRICEIYIDGRVLDLKQLYSVATIDYLYNGGDGFGMFKKGRVLLDALQHKETVQCVIDYIRDLGEIAYDFQDRVMNYDCGCRLDDTFIRLDDNYINQGGQVIAP
jgi:2',3'-cyclic-nucleotide 2'-phosphodiesterase (5'-nucleotidase family)